MAGLPSLRVLAVAALAPHVSARAQTRPRDDASFAAMRRLRAKLTEVNSLAAELQQTGALTSDAVTMIDSAFATLEREFGGLEEGDARELLFMSQVMRGTLYQQARGLSDEEVEHLPGAYTFSSPRLWDAYYRNTSAEAVYDWYGSWSSGIEGAEFKSADGLVWMADTLGGVLRPYLSNRSLVLMLGSGKSDLSEKMYEEGFVNIVNVDISRAVLDQQKSRVESAMPSMRWVHGNVSALSFAKEMFDIIVDKGTLDAMESNRPLLRTAVQEAWRVLKPRGLLMSISPSKPELRVDSHLRRFAEWEKCHSHPMKLTENQDGQPVIYMHVCCRPPHSHWQKLLGGLSWAAGFSSSSEL